MPGRRRKSWSLKIRGKVIFGRQRLLAVITAWPARQHGVRNSMARATRPSFPPTGFGAIFWLKPKCISTS